MTNREFINQLDNQDFSECIMHEDFVNMSCLESQTDNPLCNNKECIKCIALWLDKEVDSILQFDFKKEGNSSGV